MKCSARPTITTRQYWRKGRRWPLLSRSLNADPTSRNTTFAWEGKERRQDCPGEIRAAGQAAAQTTTAAPGRSGHQDRQAPVQVGQEDHREGHFPVHPPAGDDDEIGVPLLQAFDIVGKGHSNPSVGKLLLDIKADVETGSSLSQAFPQAPALLRCAVLQPRSGG